MENSNKKNDAFQIIRNEVKPSVFFKEKLLEELKAEGIVKEKKIMKSMKFYWAAAVVAALVIGYLTGTRSLMDQAQINTGKQYALFLYENEDFRVEDVGRLVEEYKNWAVDLSHKGLLISAEKLSDKINWLGQASTTNKNSVLSGYFVYMADSYQQALEIANTHPHTGYGGGVELREIEKVDQ